MLLNKLMLVVVMLCSSMKILAAGDPTRPPLFSEVKAATAYQPLELSMILNDSNNMRAIINESVVGVSDTVANAKVLSIAEDSVVVSRGGQKITLRMPLAAVRKELVNE
ncbi:MAG: hypothetical protein CMK89_06600 [Pseudomonadales bacterium]|nr:hypothetical protein [Pseudomonadales bacterium]RLU02477.1 MAG: hypothetical protein D9N11_09015 [Ketobacter sp.]